MKYLSPPTKIHDCIGGGTSFNVTFLLPDRVLKWTHKDVPYDAEQERKILELLGPHPRTVRYFGMWKKENTSIVLEYHPRGCLRQVLSGFEPNRNDADTDTHDTGGRSRSLKASPTYTPRASSTAT
jgi:hypothetical protein